MGTVRYLFEVVAWCCAWSIVASWLYVAVVLLT